MPEGKAETRPYKRGMYYRHPEWSKDKSQAYFKGTRMQVVWPLVKMAILIVLYLILSKFLEFSFWKCILVLFVVIFYYQELVARIMGYKRMPSMDAQCFISSSKSHVNFMSVSAYDKDLSWDIFMHNIEKVLATMPKISYKVVECAGDYYYEALDMHEALKMAIQEIKDPEMKLKTHQDIANYCQDSINVKMPMDGPQW